MKRNRLIKHLVENACVLYREGGNHSMYLNCITGKKTAVPRHPDIVEKIAFNICKQLEIPNPPIN
jgi:predicted RNA binding protein YcfA (HicA-like mRNA interferase family)